MRKLAIAAVATLSAVTVAAAPASAAIIFGTGNLGGGLDNVNLPNAVADNGLDFFLTGTVNPDSTLVFFTGAENIDSGASGVARIEASDGSPLNFLRISLQSGFGADAFVFNLNSVGSTGSATITAKDQLGNSYTSSAFALGTGNNFLNLTTLDNQLITEVAFTSTAVADVRQVRFGDVQTIGVVPEPATWAMMIMGFGAAGAMVRRRRSLVAL